MRAIKTPCVARAIITILSLALDPFFQQIVTYPQRPNLQGASTISRSVAFKTVDPIANQNGTNMITSDDIMWNTMFKCIMSGGAQSQLSPYCPTDDCQWSPFQRLGICSSCADISDELQFGCQNEIGDWRPGRATQSPNSMLYPPTYSCGHFFNISSEYPMLATGYATNTSMPAVDSDVLISRIFKLRTPEYPSNLFPYWNGSLRFQNVSWPLLDFVTVSSANASAAYRNQTPIAHECTLQWCVKTIQASYSGGHYIEDVLATYEENTITTNPIISFVNSHGVLCVDMLANISITVDGQNFFMDNVTAWQTMWDFSNFSPTYLAADNISSTPGARYFDDPKDHALNYGPRTITMPSFPWLPPADIPTFVDGLATSLTDTMRTYPNSTVLVPGSGAMETFIQARWAWFILPLIIVCLAFMFLVLTIHQSSTAGDVKIWKNSALAVLLNRVTEDTEKTMGPPGELSGMWERAKRVDVRLDPA